MTEKTQQPKVDNYYQFKGVVCGNYPPKFSTFSSGKCNLRFSAKWTGDKGGYHYQNFVVWGEAAKSLENKIELGDTVELSGQLKDWKPQQGGLKAECIVDRIRIYKKKDVKPTTTPDDEYIPQ